MVSQPADQWDLKSYFSESFEIIMIMKGFKKKKTQKPHFLVMTCENGNFLPFL